METLCWRLCRVTPASIHYTTKYKPVNTLTGLYSQKRLLRIRLTALLYVHRQDSLTKPVPRQLYIWLVYIYPYAVPAQIHRRPYRRPAAAHRIHHQIPRIAPR